MAYTPFEWKDGENGGTPITAERLNHIEQGISDVELTPGPRGERGPAGEDGSDGAPGADGSDGFGTESQYNDIIARLEALESGD